MEEEEEEVYKKDEEEEKAYLQSVFQLKFTKRT